MSRLNPPNRSIYLLLGAALGLIFVWCASSVTGIFQGEGLNTRWSMPGQRSAFVGEFHYQD